MSFPFILFHDSSQGQKYTFINGQKWIAYRPPPPPRLPVGSFPDREQRGGGAYVSPVSSTDRGQRTRLTRRCWEL